MMGNETPTYAQVSEMMKAIVNDQPSPLQAWFPETWAQLTKEIEEIEAKGQIPGGLDW